MYKGFSGWRWVVVPLAAVTAVVMMATSVSAAQPIRLFEETAGAFWAPSHACADGSTVPGTLLVQTTRFFEAPATEDPDPTARLQFLAVCPGGFSFSWGAPATAATITSKKKLKKVVAVGSGVARDNLGGTHQVSFSVTWRAAGPLERTVNGPGSVTKQRVATATGQVIFDDVVLVDGSSDHPTRPAPFIRVDIER